MRMAKDKVFFKIVTVSNFKNFTDAPESVQNFWVDKSERLGYTDAEKSYQEKAGIYAEFAQVVGVGIAFEKKGEFRFKFIHAKDERTLLTELTNLLNEKFNPSKYQLCGYNIREFDVPFLSRRLLINNIELPSMIKVSSTKPWDYPHIELLDFWKFGDHKSYIPMELMCNVLQVVYSPVCDSAELRWFYFSKDFLQIEEYIHEELSTMNRLIQRFYP